MAEPDSTSLAEVLDRVLDKGVVVDVQARVSLVGIEVMTVEGQVVAASLDTYYENREEIEAVEHGTIDDGDGEAAAEVVDAASEALDAATESVESTAETAGNALETTTNDGSDLSGESSDEEPGDSQESGNDDEAETVPEGNVRCRECGEVFEAITPSHLATHEMSVEDYREKHGEDVPMQFGGV